MFRKEQEKQGFTKLLGFLDRNNIKYKDVSENSIYFDKDIDILVFNWDKEISVEVKFDYWLWKTGNFFLEVVSNEEKTTKWCFLKSEALVWFYVDTCNEIIYILPLEKVRKWFFDIRKNLKWSWYKEFEKIFSLKATSTEDNDWVYRHTTIWRLVNKKYILWWLKMSGIEYLQLWFDDLLDLNTLEEIL